jgi:hypothetical protein
MVVRPFCGIFYYLRAVALSNKKLGGYVMAISSLQLGFFFAVPSSKKHVTVPVTALEYSAMIGMSIRTARRRLVSLAAAGKAECVPVTIRSLPMIRENRYLL